MTCMQVYAKMVLHAARHPSRPVVGLLLSDSKDRKESVVRGTGCT